MLTRFLLFLLLPIIYFACKSTEPITADGTEIYFDQQMAPFYHGVASGDPLENAVIIWTRVTPTTEGAIDVLWYVSTDDKCENIVQNGTVSTNASKDYTVKVDVQNLQAATSYYYHFEALGKKSMIGRTKTLNTSAPEQVKLAIVSCSNFEAGYFNAFGRIAELEDLDAVLHLGDYIYEYGIGYYGDTTLGRLNIPPTEILKLDDYRTRYALYRLDKDFQKAHQMHPFITIWDDHEITNNSYVDGAQNHQLEEGDYNVRKSVARQAYYEWLPVRDNANLYRTFKYGDLIDLIMLDERLAGRSAQADSVNTEAYRDTTRSMLGQEQLDWFFDQLKNSSATWKVIGNQVIFSDLSFKNVLPNGDLNMDAWDGYPAEKQKILEFLKSNAIQNTIFVTGDTHCSWAFETPSSRADYLEKGVESVVAFELGTTSISSANYDEYTSIDTVRMVEKAYQLQNPHLKYVNLSEHGYLLLTLTSAEAKAEWKYVETIKKASTQERSAKQVLIKNGANSFE